MPALKTLLTDLATRDAIDQLFEVPGWDDVSILRLLVVSCTISPLIVCFSFPLLRACARCMRGCGQCVCVLHESGSMCTYAYDTCAHMWVGVLSFL